MKTGTGVILLMVALTSICDTVNQLFLKSAVNELKFSPTFNIIKIFKFIKMF